MSYACPCKQRLYPSDASGVEWSGRPVPAPPAQERVPAQIDPTVAAILSSLSYAAYRSQDGGPYGFALAALPAVALLALLLWRTP